MIDTSSKICTGCRELKPLDEFYRQVNGPKGRTTKCKVCIAEYDATRAALKNKRAKVAAKTPEGKIRNKAKYDRANAVKRLKSDYSETNRRNNLRKYGLTLEEYFEMLESQNYQCGICPNKFDSEAARWFHVDHDHNCCGKGKACKSCIRGLLCHGCNTGLGAFRDDPELLFEAMQYLYRVDGG